MTELERLTVLIKECAAIHESGFDPDKRISAEALARYLLANGVILPPCKVGDTVWIVFSLKSSDKEEWFMTQDVVQGLVYGLNGFFVETRKMRTYPESKIGDTIFLTREEAESALERRKEVKNE